MDGGVLLVHGGMCTSSCWSPVAERLALPVIAVDLPGRGSRRCDLLEVSLDDCVRTVLEYADDAGWRRFALVGHSLGGVTVTETAHRCPDRITHLVYVGALIPGPGQGGCGLAYGADWPAGEIATIDEGVARAMFGNDLTDDQWATWWPSFVPEAPRLMNARLSGYPNGVPTTYVGLTDDVAVPPTLWDEMTSHLPAPVDRRQIDAGHMVMWSKPTELAALLSELLTESLLTQTTSAPSAPR
ncbi:hypothetical protein CYL16_16525 [Mycobacterium sp. EPG1]|nr:hypothetical protein CYL16_16525 [Mycobacterium sp. EPG1]